MIRLFNNVFLALRFPQSIGRCYSVVSHKSFNDLDREKKIKFLELEISMLQQEDRKVPDLEKLTSKQWDHILELASKSARRKYYQYLWQIEMRQQSRNLKKEKKKVENEIRFSQLRDEPVSQHIHYGLSGNRIFLMIRESTITHHNNVKLIQSMMFEQKLIIDCSYDEHMVPLEAVNAGKQLMMCFGENRLHPEPFDLHLCNVNLNSIATRALHRHIPTMLEPGFPMNIHRESMTDKFDKNRLVYLTPHCRNELLEYSHDDIYIIGAFVDKGDRGPQSLAKAKKLGLRMAKLPFDRYLSWSEGSGKSLPLNQIVNIMLEMKQHGDWRKALRFVPKRKINDYSSDQNFDSSTRFISSRNYDSPRRNSDHRNISPESSRFSYEKSRFSRQNENYDKHPDLVEQRSFSLDKSRVVKERKHFNKFEFNINTWARKIPNEDS